jgi:hypothetical protein
MNRLFFGWGPGVGPRLLAPGLPDALIAAEGVICWPFEEGLFLLRGSVATFVETGAVLGLVPTAEGWTLLTSGGPTGLRLRRLDPDGSLLGERSISGIGRAPQLGAGLVAWRKGADNIVLPAAEGAPPLRLPIGPREGLLGLWTDQPGLIWADEQRLYRMSPGGRPQSAGSLNSDVRRLVAGPCGAALLLSRDGQWALPPGGLPVPVEIALELDGARFSADGQRAIVRCEEGLALIDTRTGGVLTYAEGADLSPVGFDPAPLLLDESTGELRTFEGELRADGFVPTSPTLADDRLAGPGGRVWDLRTGAASPSLPELSADLIVSLGEAGWAALIGETLSHLSAECEPLAHHSLPAALLPEADPPLEGAWDGRHLWLLREAGWLRASLETGELVVDERGPSQGSTAAPPPEVEPPSLDRPEQAALVAMLGIDAERRCGDRRFLWRLDGALWSVPTTLE